MPGGPRSQSPDTPPAPVPSEGPRGGKYGVVNTGVDTRSPRVTLTSQRDS